MGEQAFVGEVSKCPNCGLKEGLSDGIVWNRNERFWDCWNCGHEWTTTTDEDDASPPTAGEAE